MDLDFNTLNAGQRYKLLASLVLPRPIALVISRDADGTYNAAPFSFFNCFGADPALVILGISNLGPGVPKDTAANIEATGQFVVNLVDEPMAERMDLAALDFPAGVNEIDEVGLTTAACFGTDLPRIAESPVSFACKLHSLQHVGNNRLVLGEVTAMTVRDGVVDPQTLRVNAEELTTIGRMASPSWYCKTTDRFEIHRPTLAQWQARNE